MRVTYSYRCDKCAAVERQSFDDRRRVPKTMKCSSAGCAGMMLRQMPKPAVHNKLKRATEGGR